MRHDAEANVEINDCLAGKKFSTEDQLNRQIDVLYDFLGRTLGMDSIEKRIEGTDIKEKLESSTLDDKICALHRLVFENSDIEMEKDYSRDEVMEKIEEGIADIMARRSVEHRLEVQVVDKMEKKQRQYMEEIKLQILNKKGGPENANTLRKYANLEKLESKKLSGSAIKSMRPERIEDIVGQDRGIKALITKLASPFPQHVIIYGPPGVGKTTAARLILEMAKKMPYTPFDEEARFVEVDGTTLRWDPREITNPLLGSVHDPIYQGTKRDLAETGIPEPKTGLVTEAHTGVLFIDEIGEIDLFLQNKLLKVLEDKRVSFDSSYYDPHDENIPKYVKKLFDEGAPADFILIGATTRHPSEINPALRSRCAEVFFEPLTPGDIENIVINAAKRLGVSLEESVAATISQYTIEGRKAVSLLTDAYGMALYHHRGDSLEKVLIKEEDIKEVLQASRMTPYTRKGDTTRGQTGKIFGLGVNGFIGSTIEFEAVSIPAIDRGKGTMKFNDTAGSMAKDSVNNASAVLRSLTGKEISEYDIHVNAVGGGRIDGPSAGAAITLVILSAIENRPLRQDIAITGEISIRGQVKPVGGVYEKIYGAKRAGMRTVLIPKDNEGDIPPDIKDIEIIPISHIGEALEYVWMD